MFLKGAFAVAGFAALVAWPTSSSALTGADCAFMNDYIRAVGTVENGTGACGMSMEEAQRILAAHDREGQVAEPPAPTRHAPRKHRRKKTHHQ